MKETVLLETASQALGLRPEELLRRLTSLGAEVGPPWAQDEKYAALISRLSLINKRKSHVLKARYGQPSWLGNSDSATRL